MSQTIRRCSGIRQLFKKLCHKTYPSGIIPTIHFKLDKNTYHFFFLKKHRDNVLPVTRRQILNKPDDVRQFITIGEKRHKL